MNSCEKKRSERQRRKGKCIHLNVEFQKIARRENKAFLSDQCKEIEKNNRMGKTRSLQEEHSAFLGFTGRRQWHPTPVLLPGKSHGQRSLVGCSPWDCQESDMTEQIHFHFSHSCIGEGNGNPLRCFCLENPRDGGAWWAAVCTEIHTTAVT